MLVIDRVELAGLDQIDSVGTFYHRDAGRLQKQRETLDEIVDLVDMRDDIVGKYGIGTTIVGHEIACQVGAKEVVDRWNKTCLGLPCRRQRGIDTKARDLPFDKVSEQIAIIARHLYDQRAGTELLPFDDHFREFARMTKKS